MFIVADEWLISYLYERKRHEKMDKRRRGRTIEGQWQRKIEEQQTPQRTTCKTDPSPMHHSICTAYWAMLNAFCDIAQHLLGMSRDCNKINIYIVSFYTYAVPPHLLSTESRVACDWQEWSDNGEEMQANKRKNPKWNMYFTTVFFMLFLFSLYQKDFAGKWQLHSTIAENVSKWVVSEVCWLSAVWMDVGVSTEPESDFWKPKFLQLGQLFLNNPSLTS